MNRTTRDTDLSKCDFEYGTKDENGNTTWAIEVPDDANVQVQMVVRDGGSQEIVGGCNLSGRHELTHYKDGDS